MSKSENRLKTRQLGLRLEPSIFGRLGTLIHKSRWSIMQPAFAGDAQIYICFKSCELIVFAIDVHKTNNGFI